MEKLFLSFIIFTITTTAYGLDPKKCFKVTHGNGLVKYDFPGYLSGEYLTKKYGSTGASSESSSQTLTSTFDPMVTTGRFVSSTQFTSSEGGCSYYSMNHILRDQYFVKNDAFILDEMAMGRGEHLKSIYYYSNCQAGEFPSFRKVLQENYPKLRLLKDHTSRIIEIDSLIEKNPKLSKQCITVG